MKNENLPQLIRSKRIRLNYTQQHLADISGISLRSLQRIEQGQVTPRAYTLNTIAAHLEIDLTTIIDKDDTVIPAAKDLRLVWSIGTGTVLLFMALAFVFQSPTFPETAFELTLYIACVVAFYLGLLGFIWRKKS